MTVETAEERPSPGGPSRRAVAGWGPYLSERQWGTVREDYSTTVTHGPTSRHDQARSRAYRWGEDGLAGYATKAAPVLRARPVERARPDPQGAPVRPDQRRGQSRRGREGVLLLPRQPPTHTYQRWLYKYPQRRVPVRRTDGHERAPIAPGARSTSCSTRASSTRTATSTSRSSTPRPGPEDLAVPDRRAQPRPEDAPIHLLPTLWFRNTWSWGNGHEPKPGAAGIAPADPVVAGRAAGSATYRLHAEGRCRRCCSGERDELGAALGRAERARPS